MDESISRWQFIRGETFEILSVLDSKKLLFKPDGEKWQAMYAQFSCMAKTQRVYAKAVEEAEMNFEWFHSLELPDKKMFANKGFALDYLKESNQLWLAALEQSKGRILWFGKTISTSNHISRLAEHERLHHGQLISYFTIANIELPKNFKSNWAL